jgi:LysR family transcriptional regulator (chromosome initiation inhibitor)
MFNSNVLLDPKLKAFLAVASQGSMHAAAKSIHLTQTTVTQRIRSLEERLSCTLFIRNRQGVIITDAGKALLEYCHKSQDLAGQALAKLTGNTSTFRLSISGPSSFMESIVVPIVETMMKKHSNLLFTLSINDSKERALSLQQGLYDLVVIEPSDVLKEMETKTLAAEQYVLVGAYDWAQRSLEDILTTEKIIDFDKHDSMSLNYLAKYQLLASISKERHFVNTNQALIPLFIRGAGYGVLTQEIARPYLANKQLCLLNQGKRYKNPLVLAWYKRPNPHDYFSQFISAF